MGVSRVGLWTVGSVSVRTAPLVRGLRDVLAFLRFVLVLGPIVGGWYWRGGIFFALLVRDVFCMQGRVFFVFFALSIHDVFCMQGRVFCLFLGVFSVTIVDG